MGLKKAKEASSINDQELEQTEDRDLDKTKTKKKEKEKYPCAICGENVGNSSRECKGCDKWVHYRCHVSNKGIGWNDDPEKKRLQMSKMLKKYSRSHSENDDKKRE